MTQNPLQALAGLGQSFWYDGLDRHMLEDGELRRMVEEDGLRGVTSNPTIFHRAVSHSDRYGATIRRAIQAGKGDEGIYDAIAQEDIRAACDLLRPVYNATNGTDGFVSLEESPHLAHDTEASIREGHRLMRLIDRPNLLVKVPATAEGVPAIQALLTAGISVNITLMFALNDYDRVADAYIAAQEERLRRGDPLNTVASVASMFVSRIDTKVDGWIDAMIEREIDPSRRDALPLLRGKLAIANAKRCYQRYKDRFHSERFERLRSHGARPQRVLFASTSTKDPTYPDTYYIDNLIGPETVATMAPESVPAFRDHGKPAPTLEQGMAEAEGAVRQAANLGIDLDRAMRELQDEGVQRFAQSFDDLLSAIREQRRIRQASA